MSDRQQALIQAKIKKGGLRARIDAKCIECIYDPISGFGGWRFQVQNCTGYSCPLYDVRPVSKPKTPDLSNQLDDFSSSECNGVSQQ